MPQANPNLTLLAGPPASSTVSASGVIMISESKWKGWISRTLIFVLIVGCLIAFQAFAEQSPRNAEPRPQIQHQHKRSILDEQVSRFAKNLDLTEAQKSAVKKVLAQQQQEILRIRRDPSLVGRAGIDRVRALQQTTVERIRAILNEEQKKKYDPLAPRRLPQSPQQPSVEDWLKATKS
jgi:Spy/CpxP family protein refolding chaperone